MCLVRVNRAQALWWHFLFTCALHYSFQLCSHCRTEFVIGLHLVARRIYVVFHPAFHVCKVRFTVANHSLDMYRPLTTKHKQKKTTTSLQMFAAMRTSYMTCEFFLPQIALIVTGLTENNWAFEWCVTYTKINHIDLVLALAKKRNRTFHFHFDQIAVKSNWVACDSNTIFMKTTQHALMARRQYGKSNQFEYLN